MTEKYTTSIRIYSDTKDRLKARGFKDESYDKLLNRLMNELENLQEDY